MAQLRPRSARWDGCVALWVRVASGDGNNALADVPPGRGDALLQRAGDSGNGVLESGRHDRSAERAGRGKLGIRLAGDAEVCCSDSVRFLRAHRPLHSSDIL